MYPEDCFHSVCEYTDWWERSEDTEIKRGELISVHVPYVNSQPYRLIPLGRETPTEHTQADYAVEPHDAARPPRIPPLPVAGLALNENEIYYAYRAKDRPVIVLSTGGVPLARRDRVGTARWRTTETLTVVPSSRAVGWRPELVTRIRHCEWPQYMWDLLPHTRDTESVLMFGQIQVVGKDFRAFRKLGYRLSEEALAVVDDWLGWFLRGDLAEDGDLLYARELLLNP